MLFIEFASGIPNAGAPQTAAIREMDWVSIYFGGGNWKYISAKG